jgi:hypothetical protein
MVNGAAGLSKKTTRALTRGRPQAISPAHAAQRLRRIRNDLALLLSTVDDGLQRIESERQPSQTGDFQNGAASGTV